MALDVLSVNSRAGVGGEAPQWEFRFDPVGTGELWGLYGEGLVSCLLEICLGSQDGGEGWELE